MHHPFFRIYVPRMKAIFTFVALLINLSVSAQVSPGSLATNFSFAESALKPSDSLSNHTPFKFTFRQKHFREVQIASRSALALATGASLGLISYQFADEPLKEFALKHQSEASTSISAVLQPLGHSDYMLPAGGMVYATGLALRNPKLQRTGILLVSSMLINDMVTSKLKDEFQRRRPDEANHNTYFEGGEGGRHYASFPSSHTSTAFTFATSVATVYHDHKWVPPVAYSMATLVGLSRIHDNKHWSTDVLAGAAVGFATSKCTNFMLNQIEKQLVRKKINIYLLPSMNNGAPGLSFGGSL